VAASAAAAQALGKPGGVNNTAYLFFVLALAFIIFITVKGDLPKWLGLFGLASQGATPVGTAAGSAPGTASVASGLPGLPSLPSIGQASASSPLNTSTFGGTGSEPNTYAGPTYIDSTSSF
jgi:hypothetical protein